MVGGRLIGGRLIEVRHYPGNLIKEGNLSSAQKPRPTMSGSRMLSEIINYDA